MAQDIDFQDLAAYSLRYITELVPEWLPGGRMQGNEWVCGSIRGGPGDSMRVNMSTGMWADFATDDKGGDMISLLACVDSIKQIDSAKILVQKLNYRMNDVPPAVQPVPVSKKPVNVLVKPPANLMPDLKHFIFGTPSVSWLYRDTDGSPWFWMARYEKKEGGKEFIPWCYSETRKCIVQKGWPEPRPLFNLDKLANNPDMPVLIVEGEGCVIGAERLGAEKNYVVTTWPHGSRSWHKADWSSIAGRKVLIWPDADEPGKAAAAGIADKISDICPNIKIINPDKADGWDAGDAWKEEKTWPEIIEWAKKLVTIYQKEEPIEQETIPVTTEPPPQDAEVLEPESDTIPEAVLHAEDPGPLPTRTEREKYISWGVALGSNDRPYKSISNIIKIFANHEMFKGHIWYDEFDYRVYTDMFGRVKELCDADVLKITAHLQREESFPILTSALVMEAVSLYANLNIRHSVRDWVSSIEWDGKKRIEQFFPDYLGAESNEYTESVSRNFWVGMVARVFNPGCKNDYMVVLEGPQGVGKSMALASIGENWHTESTESFGSKDFFQGLHGKIIVEIAELDSFSRAEVTRVKQVVTAQRDRFRASYGRTATDYPRQCIFVGTTNESGYLRDATGARRFWPIKCGEIKVKDIREDRAQLFAEAFDQFKNGADWYSVPHEKAKQEQEDRYQHDEIAVSVHGYIEDKTFIIMLDLAKDALRIDESRFDRRIQMRVGSILRRRGWEPRRENVGSRQIRVWMHKETPSLGNQGLLSGLEGNDVDF